MRADPAHRFSIGARRVSRPGAIICFMIAGAMAVSLGCASARDLDPTRRRTDYNSLRDLYTIIEWTSGRLTRDMQRGDWHRAKAHGTNLAVYADDLRHYTPRQRTEIEIAQYDQLAGRIRAVAGAAAFNAHVHARIQGMRECAAITVQVRALREYLRRPRDVNPGTWTERPDPSAVIGPDGEIMIP